MLLIAQHLIIVNAIVSILILIALCPFVLDILGNSTEVCRGFATCIAPNTCNCTNGKTGAYCQLNICFSINQTDPQVCSGNGKYIAPDICQCKVGFSGNKCETSSGQCAQSNSHLLVAVNNSNYSSTANISLVDMNCGIGSYNFSVPTSLIYLYNNLPQSFILLGNQEIYSADYQGVTFLRGISPLCCLNNSAAFISSVNSLSAVSLIPQVHLFSINLYDSAEDKIYTNSQSVSINGVNNDRFVTYDSYSDNIYALSPMLLTCL